MTFPDINIDKAYMENDESAILIKLSTDDCEVNIYIEQNKILDLVSYLQGHSKTEYHGGNSAKSEVHWNIDNDYLYLLVGDDSETWDIGFTFERSICKQLAVKIKDYIKRSMGSD